MRGETTSMHNTMEGESEALVNKLQRCVLLNLLATCAPQHPEC
jgi:hypothetical protein